MSHPQPTPQDDDQTPIDILTRHVRNPWGQHDGWWECMCTAVHDAQHVLDELRAAGVELVSQIGTPTWVERIHRGRQGAAPKLPNAADTPRVDSPTLIESIAQWLGERESTHLWPEIHESDKACYEVVKLPEPERSGWVKAIAVWPNVYDIYGDERIDIAAYPDRKVMMSVGEFTTDSAREIAANLLAAANAADTAGGA
jgi:hypothetical protein